MSQEPEGTAQNHLQAVDTGPMDIVQQVGTELKNTEGFVVIERVVGLADTDYPAGTGCLVVVPVVLLTVVVVVEEAVLEVWKILVMMMVPHLEVLYPDDDTQSPLH